MIGCFLSECSLQDVESNRFARHEIKNGMLNCISLTQGVVEMLEEGVQVTGINHIRVRSRLGVGYHKYCVVTDFTL